MNIGYALKIGFRTVRSTSAVLQQAARTGGRIRIGRKGPTVTQAAAAGIIAGWMNKEAKKAADKDAAKVSAKGTRKGSAKDTVKTSENGSAATPADRPARGRSRIGSALAGTAVRTGRIMTGPSGRMETVCKLVKMGRKLL